MFATGDGLLRQTDETTDDGLKQIFAANLFGHFILVSLCVLSCSLGCFVCVPTWFATFTSFHFCALFHICCVESKRRWWYPPVLSLIHRSTLGTNSHSTNLSYLLDFTEEPYLTLSYLWVGQVCTIDATSLDSVCDLDMDNGKKSLRSFNELHKRKPLYSAEFNTVQSLTHCCSTPYKKVWWWFFLLFTEGHLMRTV